MRKQSTTVLTQCHLSRHALTSNNNREIIENGVKACDQQPVKKCDEITEYQFYIVAVTCKILVR